MELFGGFLSTEKSVFGKKKKSHILIKASESKENFRNTNVIDSLAAKTVGFYREKKNA